MEQRWLRRSRPLSSTTLTASDAEGTVRFARDGTEYEIDLDAEHTQALQNVLALCLHIRGGPWRVE
jgi:hypothetical protein